MRQARVTMLIALLALVGALPAVAEVYTITLSNGAIFESRYQPRAASWDAGMLELLTETGAWIALPKSMVTDIVTMSETKGFGRVLNTTTVDLGFAPNDMPEAAVSQDTSREMLERAMTRYDVQQFAEPAQAGRPNQGGGGIPVWGLSVGGDIPQVTQPGAFATPSAAPQPPPIPVPAESAATAPQ